MKVKPNKQQGRLVKGVDGGWIAEVNAPAHDNLANERLIEIIAEHFGVAYSRVSVVSGFKSSTKTIEIQ